MIDDFNIYIEAFKDFLTVTDNAGAGQEKKKAYEICRWPVYDISI